MFFEFEFKLEVEVNIHRTQIVKYLQTKQYAIDLTVVLFSPRLKMLGKIVIHVDIKRII